MGVKTAEPRRPYVSGFCNPTLPRTPAYDPHQRCHGCTCTAVNCPCNPDNPNRQEPLMTAEQPPSDQGEKTAHPQVSPAEHGTDPVTLPEALRRLADAAEIANVAAAGDGITCIPWQDAVRLLVKIRDTLDLIKNISDGLTKHVYLTGEHGKVEVDGVKGLVTIGRARDRRDWNHEGAARAVIDAHLEKTGYEVPADPWDVVEWLLPAIGINYWKVTVLRELGIEPKTLCEDTPGRASVSLPPRG